jgi:decaprenyl-phosphate phosphoribosyltransferase
MDGHHRGDSVGTSRLIEQREIECTGSSRLSPRSVPLLTSLARTARIKQWSKNVLVLAAPGAAGVLTRSSALLHCLAAVAIFCLVSTGTYFINDVVDFAADRQHPEKRRRPIAAGAVNRRFALLIGVTLLLTGTGLGVVVTWKLGVVLAIYVGIQIAYSLFLKTQPVLDLVAVASGFVLRAIAGAVAVGVSASEWFLIVTTFASLLMVTGKRLAEHAVLGDARGTHRPTLDLYSQTYLRSVLAISAAGAMVGYCLWAFSLQTALDHHHDPVWYQLSIVPFLVALLRYTYLVDGENGGRPEELVFADGPLLLLGLLWTVLFTVGIYVK